MARIAITAIILPCTGRNGPIYGTEEPDRHTPFGRLAAGVEALAALESCDGMLGRCVERLRAAGHEIVPLLWAAAAPAARYRREMLADLEARLREAAGRAGPVDAAVLRLSGRLILQDGALADHDLARAMGEWVPAGRLLAQVDPLALDLPAIAAEVTAIISPLGTDGADEPAAGERSAALVHQLLEGVHARMVSAEAPGTIPPWLAESPRGEKPVGAVSLGQVTPDGQAAPTRMVGIGRDETDARAQLAKLIQLVEGWGRHRLEPSHPDTLVEIVRARHGHENSTVVIDADDNPGAGDAGDDLRIAHRLLHEGLEVVVGPVCDPHVATVAARAGEGGTIYVHLGGKHREEPAAGLDGDFTVEWLSTEAITAPYRLEPETRAVLRLGSVRFLVVGRRIEGHPDVFPEAALAGADAVLVKGGPHATRAWRERMQEPVLVSEGGMIEAGNV